MKLTLNNHAKLFFTGIIQVYFVAVNTVFLAKEIYVGVFFAAFMISMIWSYNVKKIVFGTLTERASYALGAALGSLLGLFTSGILSEMFRTL